MTRGRIVYWVLFAAMAALYLTMLLWTLPRLRDMAGGLMPFDLRPFGYSTDEARTLLGALGVEGRGFYGQVQHLLDSAYPALLAVVLVLSFRWAAPGVLGRVLGGLAIVAALFDYAENRAVRVMLQAGAEATTDAMVGMASQMTVAKSMTVSVALFALLFLALRAGFRRIRENR